MHDNGRVWFGQRVGTTNGGWYSNDGWYDNNQYSSWLIMESMSKAFKKHLTLPIRDFQMPTTLGWTSLPLNHGVLQNRHRSLSSLKLWNPSSIPWKKVTSLATICIHMPPSTGLMWWSILQQKLPPQAATAARSQARTKESIDQWRDVFSPAILGSVHISWPRPASQVGIILNHHCETISGWTISPSNTKMSQQKSSTNHQHGWR